MTTPLKSVLVTEWSRNHIAGHDLDGGALVSFEIDTTVVGTEALGHDLTEWNIGDIATLKIDHETHLAQLRIVTAKKYILRVSDFEITDVTHISLENSANHGRHIFLKGSADNGAVYIMPMLGYTAWKAPWDLSNLETVLKEKQIPHSMVVEAIDRKSGNFQICEHYYNSIFYPGTRDGGTVFDTASSMTVTTLTVRQSCTPPRVQMFTAAYVKKTKESYPPGPHGSFQEKKGTAFFQPYFVIDGEKVFIRTSV